MKNYDKIIGDNQMIATANSVKDHVLRRSQAADDVEMKKSMRGAAIGTLNKHVGGDEIRKVVLSWLFAGDFEGVSVRSSKTLSNAQMWAIVEWIDWWQDEDGEWHVGNDFPHEAICVLNAAVRAYNRANREQKAAISSETATSLVASMVELGGNVTQVDIGLSKIDKREKGDE